MLERLSMGALRVIGRDKKQQKPHRSLRWSRNTVRVEGEVVQGATGSRLIESVQGYFEAKVTVLERARNVVKKLEKYLKAAEESAREGNVGPLEKRLPKLELYAPS